MMRLHSAPSPATIVPTAPDAWQSTARTFLDHALPQTPAFAATVAERDRAQLETVIIERDGTAIGACAVRVRHLPLTGGIAYVSGGPLTRRGDNDDLERFADALDALRHHYVQERGLMLRLLAPLGTPAWNAAAHRVCVDVGFVSAHQGRGYRTFLLPIADDDDTQRAGLSKYWRRNLRRSERTVLEVVTGTSPELFAPLHAIHVSMQERKSFTAGLDLMFYATVQDRLGHDDTLRITQLREEGRVIAGLVCSHLGDTAVPLILVATQDAHRQYGVYRLQWESIAHARTIGQTSYDLGGIDPEGNPGVYDFKKGLRGVDLSAPGPFECAPGAARRALIHGAERVYRAWRRAA